LTTSTLIVRLEEKEWEDMDMTLYDPITPSGAQAVMEWARLSYESVTGRAGYSDFYKKDLTLNVLGPVGDIVGEWIIKGAFIKTMSQGDFDWSAPDAVELSITVAMDYCVLNYMIFRAFVVLYRKRYCY
jgi:hypothetical protein